jgi:hypothetical protein
MSGQLIGCRDTVRWENVRPARSITLGPERALLGVQRKRFGLTRSSVWIESGWPNPVAKRTELKSVHLLKVDDRPACGSRCYREPKS